ncbi:hypothetical protein [Hyphomicrobium sp. NDB2Meth4]|uniref:hypothetical protein n=1 Tax=Hyphomicrobium sp. NDB2Meth4 TaxID=1892846 RepID=UPI000A89EF6B|nr:hypothetical protein [Hyphomicrobium sp. NDB2Meth4]
MWFRNLTIAAFLLIGAHQAAAQEDYPADGKIGVKYGPWEIRPEHGGSVARNIIDADNWRYYAFWVEPLIVEVMTQGGHMVGGTLTVEGGVTSKFICYAGGDRCTADRTKVNTGLRTGRYAVLELDLTEGRKAGPFNIPLEGLSAFLFMGGNQGDNSPAPPKPPPPKWENMNPEPEVNPQPRR